MQILIQKEDLKIIEEALQLNCYNGITIGQESPFGEMFIHVELDNATATDIYSIAQWVLLQKTKSLLNQ